MSEYKEHEALIHEVIQRFGSLERANNWLQTPIFPDGKRPIDYLEAGEYDIFRGFLLRVHTGQEVFHLLPMTNRVHIERSREEFEDALERLRPRA